MTEESSTSEIMRDAALLADERVEELTNAETIDFIREFVNILAEHELIIAGPDSATESVYLALQSLYICELFKKAFVKGYEATDEHLKKIADLNRQFKL